METERRLLRPLFDGAGDRSGVPFAITRKIWILSVGLFPDCRDARNLRPLWFPVPESKTLCGLFCTLSLIVTIAVRDFFAVGWNVTLIVQLFFGCSVAGQL